MDPNKVLADLRDNVQLALGIVYTAKTVATKADLLDLLREVAEDFDNLDTWLMTAGSLPNDWADAQEADKRALRAALTQHELRSHLLRAAYEPKDGVSE